MKLCVGAELKEPHSEEPHSTIICFSHLRWDFVYQRPQHLLSRAARSHAVYFFEEPLFEKLEEPRLKLLAHSSGVTVATPVLPEGLDGPTTASIQRHLLNRLLSGITTKPLISWYYTPMALTFSRYMRCDVCVYDNMDELSAFAGAPPELLALEKELFGRADVVFTGGRSLYEAKRGRHLNIHSFPSSIDLAHFAFARTFVGPEPEDQAQIPHPRVGFFGVIDERMNLPLVAELAQMRPDWHLVMIGPVAKIDVRSLPQAPNVHWLGSKPYSDLPKYLACWDAGMMPFALNESTRFISPTKTPEFLAAGVPVVSTPIPDVVRPYGMRGLVEIAETAEGFAHRIGSLLNRHHQDWRARVEQQLASSSWDRTWDSMEALIIQGLNRRHTPGLAVAAE